MAESRAARRTRAPARSVRGTSAPRGERPARPFEPPLVSDDDGFCRACGAALAPGVELCPSCGLPRSERRG